MFSSHLLHIPSIPVALWEDEDSVPDFKESFCDGNILGNHTNGCYSLVVITNSNFLKYYFYLYVPRYFHRTLELKGNILL